MKIKFSVDNDFSDEYDIVCICTHMKDYKLVWNINNRFNFSFRKIVDFKAETEGREENHEMYYYFDNHEKVEYFLLGNKCNNSLLFPVLSQVDYLMIMRDQDKSRKIEILIEEVRKIPNIQTVFMADKGKLKNFNNIISKLEEEILAYNIRLKSIKTD
jgi:hypothetical protein